MKNYKPKSINELINILNNELVLIYANGASKKYKNGFPKSIVYLSDISDLKNIEKINSNNLGLGTMLSIKDLINSKKIANPIKEVLKKDIDRGSSLGGLIFKTEFVSKLALLLYTYNAYLNLVSVSTDRYVPINEFYTASNSIKANEFLKRIILPLPDLENYFYFTSTEFSLFILYKITDNRIKDIRISFLFDKVVRSKYLENKIISRDQSEFIVPEIVDLYIQEITYVLKKDYNLNKELLASTLKKYLNCIF